MTRATDTPADGNGEDEEPEPDEDRASIGHERRRVDEVDHTHPHTDDTFDETGVHGRGKARADAKGEKAEEGEEGEEGEEETGVDNEDEAGDEAA